MVLFDGALTAWRLPALQEQAEAGNTEAQFGLGRVYWYGAGLMVKNPEEPFPIKQNYYKAVIWFEEAAKKGESRAQDYLGLAYASGAGGKHVDLKQAFEWFEKSALQNNLCAQIHLAQAYAKGAGVEKDCRRANDWVHQAVSSPEWNKEWIINCDEKSESLQKIEKEGLECVN
ncbi:sel1 repeat protein [Lasius niger]|uniref:Sel1 repeat protein n=1 Tax=Lasius niger TaxID=67767 RepID=A0A0J7KMB4_LASNI|nr:sel1 repeat protein [Lasius niger]